MTTLTTYRYKIWVGGEYIISRRMATRTFIEGLRKAILLENTAHEVDDETIDDNGQAEYDSIL